MAVTISYLIYNSISIYITYYFINHFLYKKKFSTQRIFISYALYFIITTLVYFYHNNALHNLVINFVLVFLMTMLYYCSFQKKILAAVFIDVLNLASDVFAVIIISLFSQSSYREIMSKKHYIILGFIICAISQYLMVKLLKPLFSNHGTELPGSYWLAVFLIPTSSIYILYSMNHQYIAGGIKDLPFILITIGILFAINILVFYLYNKLIKDEEIKYENILLHQQKTAYENQSRLIHEFQNRFTEQKHDMKGQLVSVKRLVEENQIDNALDYLDKLIGKTREIRTGMNSGNIVIDAMVDSKFYLANLQHTEFYVNVELTNPLQMDPIDLTAVLCNLLDNALEACIKLPEGKRKIWFGLSYQHDILTITIKNTYNPDALDIREGKVYTTKADKHLHGIGLRRVSQSVEKYNGSFTYNTSESLDGSVFIADIILESRFS